MRDTFEHIVGVIGEISYSLLVVQWTLDVVSVIGDSVLSYKYLRIVVMVLDPVQDPPHAMRNFEQPDWTGSNGTTRVYVQLSHFQVEENESLRKQRYINFLLREVKDSSVS